MNHTTGKPSSDMLRHWSEIAVANGEIRRYNLVYRTPVDDPAQGLPIGDGETGALIAFEGSKLVVFFNRTDLWQDAARPGAFCNWAREEEESSTTLRHGGRLELDFVLPVFESIYLKDCEIELHLESGEVTGRIESAMGSVRFSALFSEQQSLFRLRGEYHPAEPVHLQATLSRYGSRTFSHWYSRRVNTPEAGLSGTESFGDANAVGGLTHPVTDGFFALAFAPASVDVGSVRHAWHETRLPRLAHEVTFQSEELYGGESETAGRFECEVLLTAPEYPDAATAASEVSKTLRQRLAALDYEEELAGNQELYRKFWSRSMVNSGNDYLDRLWMLQLFYCNASQRGRYPARFMHALWSFQHDFQPWNFYFHWNQQMTYFMLPAAGHAELCRSYLDFRSRGVARAEATARKLFPETTAGGWVSDVSDRRNESSAHEKDNHTVMAQIAGGFAQYVRYTGDLAFLREHALPYLRSATEFLISRFEWEADGKAHAISGTAYEGWIPLHDVCTELNTMRSLARDLRAMEMLSGATELSELCRNASRIAEALPDLPLLDDLAEFEENGDGRCAIGFYRGERLTGRSRLAAGVLTQEQRVVSSIVKRKVLEKQLQQAPEMIAFQLLQKGSAGCAPGIETEGYDGIFPFAELSAVYPSGNLDLGQKDTPLFAAACNTALLGATEGGWIAWDPTAIHLARLGLGKRLFAYLERFAERWQNFANGHFVDSLMTREMLSPLALNKVADVESGSDEHRRNVRAWEFRHLGTEGLSVTATALTEALLQSSHGVIRIFPALDEAGAGAPVVRFTLFSEGGHQISALRPAGGDSAKAGAWVTMGWQGTLQMASFAPGMKLAAGVVSAGGVTRVVDAETNVHGVMTLRGKPGSCFFVAGAEVFEEALAHFCKVQASTINSDPPQVAHCGVAQLGMDRLF